MLRQLACHLGLGVASLAAQSILPPPPVPAGNPQTPQKVLLGKALFWDEQLSASRTVACGTCHVFGSGGSDPRAFTGVHPGSDGLYGTPDDVHGSFGVVRTDSSGAHVPDPVFGLHPQVTHRRAPSVINAAYAASLFYDGRATGVFTDPVSGAVVLPSGGALESQIAGPPVSATEMSHIGRSWTDIANDLQNLTPLALASNVPAALQQFVAGQTYGQLFQQVYGSPVTPVGIIFAIAAYERTLISDQSPFDYFLAGQGTLSPIASAGLARFQALCINCHTDLIPAVLTVGPVLNDFRNIGVRPIAEDVGRSAVTGQSFDDGLFKIPGLRNVELRAPYFHNGSVNSLAEVVDFYARGGDFFVNQDPFLPSIPGQVSLQDRLSLVTLLQTLTDPNVQNELPPFDRPRLFSEGPLAAQIFGTGTAGSGGVTARSSLNSAAYRGNSRFALGLDQTAPGAYAWLALDVAAGTTPVSLLGHDVYLAMTPALYIVSLPGVTLGSGAGGGYATLPLPIPNTPQLAGLPLFGQWLVLDAAGPYGATTSDAFGFTVY